jgi:hypothetical protein
LVVQMTTKYFWEFLTLLFTELNSVSLQSWTHWLFTKLNIVWLTKMKCVYSQSWTVYLLTKLNSVFTKLNIVVVYKAEQCDCLQSLT